MNTYDKPNIFKQDIIHPECKFLNKYKDDLIGNCFYDKDNNKNILKYFTNQHDFECEAILHLYLLNKRITTEFDLGDNKLLYYVTNNKISLYTYLEQSGNHLSHVLLNELFAFVNTFKKSDFIHGNLHIHNIFINPINIKFYAIDFTNSIILQKHQKGQALEFLEYWDFFTLYKSLLKYYSDKPNNKLYKSNHKSVDYLQKLIVNYIHPKILELDLDL